MQCQYELCGGLPIYAKPIWHSMKSKACVPWPGEYLLISEPGRTRLLWQVLDVVPASAAVLRAVSFLMVQLVPVVLCLGCVYLYNALLTTIVSIQG